MLQCVAVLHCGNRRQNPHAAVCRHIRVVLHFAVRCGTPSVLQCVAVRCGAPCVLQYVAVRCGAPCLLQCVAARHMCCSVLRRAMCAAVCNVLWRAMCVAVCCSALQRATAGNTHTQPSIAISSTCVACCSVLQRVAVCCSVWQCDAVHHHGNRRQYAHTATAATHCNTPAIAVCMQSATHAPAAHAV